MEEHQHFIREAARIGEKGMLSGAGGPFGAVVVCAGEIIGSGHNRVLELNDPTAHAEIMAIRKACEHLGSYQLTDCLIYTSCEPCPMCLGAIYWARAKAFYYACSREDAKSIGFDDSFIYSEIDNLPGERSIPGNQISREEGLRIFQLWDSLEDKGRY